jgi:hypothetical protein
LKRFAIVQTRQVKQQSAEHRVGSDLVKHIVAGNGKTALEIVALLDFQLECLTVLKQFAGRKQVFVHVSLRRTWTTPNSNRFNS